ncbi:hypothetical protein PENFLA_c036G00998 [Penicillium flavigenum]|uniref:Uncharacterized protein n=1 Tax=Penicillium flavigenum TaxID=254877 RepID=A0A1V6SM61_9EURO|nr:hypothetical protein PENFLA_c036G00998 [Penicillium flavigenum]
MSDTARMNTNTGANHNHASTARATPAEAWRSIPHRATLNVTSHVPFSQIIVQVINQQVDHEGIPPSAARDARVAELIARAVQAQVSVSFTPSPISTDPNLFLGMAAAAMMTDLCGLYSKTSMPMVTRPVVVAPMVVAPMAVAVVMGRVDVLIVLAVLSVFAVVAAVIIMLLVKPSVLTVVVAVAIIRLVKPSVLAVVVAVAIIRLVKPSILHRRGGRGAINGRGAVNGVPGHQAPRAPAANHGPQWWTQPQTGPDEMSDVDAP